MWTRQSFIKLDIEGAMTLVLYLFVQYPYLPPVDFLLFSFLSNLHPMFPVLSLSPSPSFLLLPRISPEHYRWTHLSIYFNWPAPRRSTDHSGLECASVFEFIDYLIVCVLVGKYSNFSPHPPLFP